ncbi:NAD(P)-dependent alcohol dehydrogenase [Microbacterium sp. CIAB417]|uniref:NAD(P)-dependent alcohol dehydrogenase n=1 Tax=Microbacterium sp. CIAB417 TaxID=2860287 RepID=UPI001FAC2EA5|nr:NAD(P)-dependent alcohol dehydrogenase [Microbacterium sp. CIAB417]
MTETMTAWRRESYGPAAGTLPEEVPIPVPGRGEVVLRVRATALNAGDVHVLHGDPLLVRPVFGFRRPKQPVRGMDVAGTVTAVGPEVVSAEVGEDVVGELAGGGGLAAFAVVAASRLVPRPPHVPPALAATLPIAGGTAWQALDLAEVGLREGTVPRVLIIGASGGVGTFAVQLAALRGAEVWASAGARSAALLERLGATRTLDHRETPLAELPAGRFDAVLDIAGGTTLRQLRRLAAPGGVVVLIGGEGGAVLGPIPRILAAAVLSMGSHCRIRSLAATARPEVLHKLLELVDDGLLTPVIEREYAFAEAAQALAHVEAGHTVGKVVVRGA